jgi:hypothetical protein
LKIPRNRSLGQLDRVHSGSRVWSTDSLNDDRWWMDLWSRFNTANHFPSVLQWTAEIKSPKEAAAPLATRLELTGPVHRGPSMDGRLGLIGAWPPAASVLKGASQGAENGEMGSGNPLRASLEDGRWRGGWATKGNGRWRSVCQ